ncbi:MAG: Lrp/AsnC family transcriptional regulator [Lachnospiraceae bacterium]|nr:Lrp/AsnC family transcriptional regulator [Lachnospiraceae bacterium]
MNELIDLLKDGRSRTMEMLSSELDMPVEKIKRYIEFLERTGVIKRIVFSGSGCGGQSCSSCPGCATGGKTCAGCMPEGGFQNMGVMWEVVK